MEDEVMVNCVIGRTNRILLTLILLSTATASLGNQVGWAAQCDPACDEEESQCDELGCDALVEDDSEGYGPLNDCLFGDCFSDSSGISISGWLDQGFSWNPDSPADRFNGFLSNNDRSNEYQMNQLYFSLGREADYESDSLSFGFRGDMIYGTDAFLFQTLGFDDRTVSDDDSRFYKLAFPQLYAEFYMPVGNGVTLLLGKWYTLAGYETGLATQDIFYSHTLGYNLTPFTHTGALLRAPVGDQWEVAAGVHRGSDVVQDNNNNLGFTGSIAWSDADEQTAIYFGIVTGPEQDEKRDWQDLDGVPGADTPGENINRVVYSLSIEHSLSDQLTAALNHDYFFQEASERYGIEQAEAYGLTGYLLYDISDRVLIGLRAEVLRDDDGWISSGFRSLNEPSAGVYTNLTVGMNFAITDCTVFRPELRWDWQDRDDPSDTPAFDDGSDTDQFLFAFDFVSSF